MLRLSKLEAGKQTLRLEVMDLVEEAQSLATEQSERAHEAGVDLQLDFDCEQCRCLLDPGAVQRILRNLVGNAIKFTDEGGSVTIRVERITEARPSGADDAPFTHARLQVEDTGAGMSETFQEDMFKAFRQEEQSARGGHEGSGLGLSITKQLVDLLRGEISVDSEKGVGTCFTIRLPRVPEGADASKLDARAPAEAGREESPGDEGTGAEDPAPPEPGKAPGATAQAPERPGAASGRVEEPA